MKSASGEPADLKREFEQLIHSPHWRQLAQMPAAVGDFNVFQVLEDAVCENSWSRIIAALFTSNGSHNLEMRPLRTWLSMAGNSRFKTLAKRAMISSAICEWGTMTGRRLDILIKLLDLRGHLIGIVGVENKVWSGEQHNQLSDYQVALCEAFPDVPKILVFLTPDEREPLTDVDSRLCPCFRCSYKTLVTMCDRLILSASNASKLLLSNLHDFIDRTIVSESVMKSKIDQVIRKLYQNRIHRNVLEAIFENRPTLEDVRSHLSEAAKEYFKKLRLDCQCDQWPLRAANPCEIRISASPLEKPGFKIDYMLRSKASRPFIGDSFTILIAAWCESAAGRKRVKSLKASLPKRISHNFRNWGKWEVMWEGDSYELQDLNGRDAKHLAGLLIPAISKTFVGLRSAVSEV